MGEVKPIHKIFKDKHSIIKELGAYVLKWPDDDIIPIITKKDIMEVISREQFR